ncbi:hypothetical protein [Streptomyces sp. NBC_01497]|uniref:hypothetical protein n=1 Tax=Streptomyces sp. NBC_01497 TaxID=2903885 RepID=UPI002E2F736C|nr:hypothetical protein [Streptomyces sp. NBC_01497]
MTQCCKGGHDFPIEDEYSAYCPEHGVELVWHSPHDPERPPHPLYAAVAEPDAPSLTP